MQETNFGSVDVQTRKYGSDDALYSLSDRCIYFIFQPKNTSGQVKASSSGKSVPKTAIHGRGTVTFILTQSSLKKNKRFESAEDDIIK